MGVCYGTPDFPTPSFTGSLKSGMKLTITSSSSSDSKSHDLVAAHGNQASRVGKILAESSLTVFSFAELKEATKNFGGDAQVGEGGFGYVYKGMLHGNQQSGRTKTIIAVKRLNPGGLQGYGEWLVIDCLLSYVRDRNDGSREHPAVLLVPDWVVLFVECYCLQTEIQFLGRLSHPNLAKLLGFCQEDENLALVYEFIPKGSLNNHLFRKSSNAHLPWDVRLKIAVGAARGLAFLHSSERKLIFRDFKTSNILLDGSYTAKLSNFGLVKPGPPEGQLHVSTRVMGTYGYADPVYVATGHLYVKSDVYSFGMVLLELLTGLRAYDAGRLKSKHLLVELARPLLSCRRQLRTIMDSRLANNYCIDSAFKIAQLALKCVRRTPNKRPSMSEVVEALESIGAANAN